MPDRHAIGLLLKIKHIKAVVRFIDIDVTSSWIKSVTAVPDFLESPGELIVGALRHPNRALKMLFVYRVRLFAGFDVFRNPAQNTRLVFYKQNISHPGNRLAHIHARERIFHGLERPPVSRIPRPSFGNTKDIFRQSGNLINPGLPAGTERFAFFYHSLNHSLRTFISGFAYIRQNFSRTRRGGSGSGNDILRQRDGFKAVLF